MSIEQCRGSDFIRCLFYHVQKYGYQSMQLKRIKPGVFLLETKKRNMIVKQFRSMRSYCKQLYLTQRLHQIGFSYTSSFVLDLPVFVHDNCVYGFLHYISPAKSSFRFSSIEQCQEGLTLLSSFHRHTSALVPELANGIARFNQIEKWQVRLSEFSKYVEQIEHPMYKQLFEIYQLMGKRSLIGMRNHQLNDEKECMIHGDVAYHNFLRAENGVLFLIDFDLHTCGSAKVDYLQFANRILPSCQFSLEKLSMFPQLKGFLSENYFLEALCYPTDVFREWNRIEREQGFDIIVKKQIFIENLRKEHAARIDLFNTIQTMIK